MSVLKGEHAWLESGIAAYGTEMGLPSSHDQTDAALSRAESEILAGV
jgi:hypothetical protein